jgi:arylsulfatase A-like enzyme
MLADDMGWGETSYNGQPTLLTPEIDALAEDGLTFTRFYASAPNCSPTRAALLTGRSNDRTGVIDHGYRLRREEQTIAEMLSQAGYATGHFGKWHLNGCFGAGVPILAEDPFGPGNSGFEHWVSTTNLADFAPGLTPMVSRNGVFANLTGDSSKSPTRNSVNLYNDLRCVWLLGVPSRTIT